MPPICFVTGASGFVGRHLVPLLAKQFSLRLLWRPEQTVSAIDGIPHERIDGRLHDAAVLGKGVEGADVVVHLAALVSFKREDRGALFEVNAHGAARLAAAARRAGVRRFVHVSTISAVAYRDRPEEVDETAPFNFFPLRIGYSDSKFAGELAVLDECKRGLDVVIVNPPSMYGAGDRRKGDGSLLTAVLTGKVRFAPPGGLNVANVADVCDGIVAALERGRTGERYILGGENLTGAQLLQRIANIVGGRAPSRVLPGWVLGTAAAIVWRKERWFGSKPPLTAQILDMSRRFLWCSSKKAERELGWRAGSVDAGIAAAWNELRGG